MRCQECCYTGVVYIVDVKLVRVRLPDSSVLVRGPMACVLVQPAYSKKRNALLEPQWHGHGTFCRGCFLSGLVPTGEYIRQRVYQNRKFYLWLLFSRCQWGHRSVGYGVALCQAASQLPRIALSRSAWIYYKFSLILWALDDGSALILCGACGMLILKYLYYNKTPRLNETDADNRARCDGDCATGLLVGSCG